MVLKREPLVNWHCSVEEWMPTPQCMINVLQDKCLATDYF